MTYRLMKSALLTALFLFIGQSFALAAECATCDRSYADCRTPIQARYVSCMNSNKASCGTKCSNDCKNDKEAQKCTLSCVKNCQGGSSCQGTFSSANQQCVSTYRTCKNGCTVTR